MISNLIELKEAIDTKKEITHQEYLNVVDYCLRMTKKDDGPFSLSKMILKLNKDDFLAFMNIRSKTRASFMRLLVSAITPEKTE